MRCYCCNNLLTPQESVRRFKESGTFTDMCNGCLGEISDDVDTVDGDNPEEELFDDDGNPRDEYE